ncbi:predicted protein [Naegleria gruberi]|uniref:Predicted protein n=1 Tax=Naegleria gruberi TaxID=5762 RepID=D2W682_NAEGR|nr:uncharacterized protein NAEGRDRAFT_76925 [Naegleria gruberi]EFC35421.1 predicted protein [Naegleria gruberi]|eukprot:XP_002668165.1 predicted protein [Naegleria gruberi strain NEG-M]
MSSLSKFLKEPTTVYGGLKANDLKQEPHYSFFDGENKFLVREIESQKLVPLKTKLLFEKAGSYEFYTVEHGFIPVEMDCKQFKVSDLLLLNLGKKKKVYEQEYYGEIYDKNARIIEEKRFFQDDQTEPYFGGKVVVGIKSYFGKMLRTDNSHKKLFTFNNKPLKEKKELVKTSLPIASLKESEHSKIGKISIQYYPLTIKVTRIFLRNFPLLETFEINERNNLIEYLHQMVGLYMADGNSRKFQIFLNAKNEKELTDFLIEKMKLISGDSFGIKEQIIFRDSVHNSISFANQIDLTEDTKQDLEEGGFFESNSNIVALKSL